MNLKEIERKIVDIENDKSIEDKQALIKNSINELKANINNVTEEIKKLH